MRVVAALFGNLLFVFGVGGMMLLPGVVALRMLPQPNAVSQLLGRAMHERLLLPLTSAPAATSAQLVDSAPVELVPASALPDVARVVTGVHIPRLQLDADVVTAHLIHVQGGATWEVPAYKVGHGQYTAGAGQAGNTVLLGHVSSRSAGNVFRDLDQVRVGDPISVTSEADVYTYRVAEVRVVPRTDLSVLQPTERPTLTLITCTGAWLPQLNEFADRLVVRAELAS
jgi:sortase A